MLDDGDRDDDLEQSLYDAYVELVLSGAGPAPGEFLADRDPVSDVLRERLVAVHRASVGSAAASKALPFERLGAYRVLRQLGEGGMGAVYLGEQEELGRLAALKVLRPELQGSATIAARFEREAQVVARLRHPNIVTVYGVGEERGTRFLAMEYLEGEGLDEVIAKAREDGHALPVETCVRWAVQVAGALQAAHEAGVVHRDVKPSNVRITPDGAAMLLDFGIAAEEGTAQLTRTGRMLGTTGYAAPEQVRAEVADARTDVYALGIVLYELLTGVHAFDAPTEAEMLQRVLVSEPAPARRHRAAIPRDLETVLQVATDKDRARRYASAAAFAADLAAVLAVRPIAARRAGPVHVAWKWMRRHPLAATLLAVFLVGAVGSAAFVELQRRADARVALAAARADVLAFEAAAEEAREAEEQFAWLEKIVESEYMSAEQDRRHADAERVVRESRREREAVFHRALEHLRRAEQLVPGIEGAGEVRASLSLARWREARSKNDDETAAFYRRQVLRYAPDGEFAAEVAGRGRVVLECDVPGASARLFRFALQSSLAEGGEPRLVPVPVTGEPRLTPGTWAFRLLSEHGGLLAGDLVTAVDGEAPGETSWQRLAARLRAGAAVVALGRETCGELSLPAGADVRITTQPLEWTDAEALGADGSEIPAGRFLAVVRAPGFEEARVAHEVRAGETRIVRLEPLPAGTTPPGFAYVVPSHPSDAAPFWVRETEIMAAEYLEFLDDPATLAEIDASERPIRFPRSPGTLDAGGHWPRGADGRYTLPEEWPSDWPALGVSFEDATAYCAWWTARARERGQAWSAALPTLEQWVQASDPASDRLYVFGNRFRPKWVKSCFAREAARPEPALSYPRDESVAGAFDMSGSLFEWLDEWWDEEVGTRRTAGGSWGRAQRELFKVWGGQGHAPTTIGDEFGFRIVLTRPDEGEDAR